MAELLETVPALTPGTGFQIIYFDHFHHIFPQDQKEGSKGARITQVDSVYIMSGKMEVLSVHISDFDPWLFLQKVLTPLHPQAITKLAVWDELNLGKGRIY